MLQLRKFELVIERVDWEPPGATYTPSRPVPLRIEGYEVELRSQVKAAGGRWNAEKQLWFVKYGSGHPFGKAYTCRYI